MSMFNHNTNGQALYSYDSSVTANQPPSPSSLSCVPWLDVFQCHGLTLQLLTVASYCKPGPLLPEAAAETGTALM